MNEPWFCGMCGSKLCSAVWMTEDGVSEFQLDYFCGDIGKLASQTRDCDLDNLRSVRCAVLVSNGILLIILWRLSK